MTNDRSDHFWMILSAGAEIDICEVTIEPWRRSLVPSIETHIRKGVPQTFMCVTVSLTMDVPSSEVLRSSTSPPLSET
jgi:hypothetical protein